MILKRNPKVVPIRRQTLASIEGREVADLAFALWLANGFRGVAPEEALSTAVRHWSSMGPAELFLVPKRNFVRGNLHTPSLVTRN